MVLGVGDIEVARRIQGQAPGITELAWRGAWAADDFQRLVIRIEYLDAAVAELTDVLPSRCIHADVVGVTQFTVALARLAMGADELAVAGKDLDAVVAGVGHVDSVLGIDAHPFRAVKLARRVAGMAEAGQQLFAAGGKLLPALDPATFL